jgi:hypothetical protein
MNETSEVASETSERRVRPGHKRKFFFFLMFLANSTLGKAGERGGVYGFLVNPALINAKSRSKGIRITTRARRQVTELSRDAPKLHFYFS